MRLRWQTETTTVAMPETGVGLFPDAGFALFTARMPRPAVGLHMALTGARVSGAADLLHSGIATHFVPLEQYDQMAAAMIAHDYRAAAAAAADTPGGRADRAHSAVQEVLGRFARLPPNATVGVGDGDAGLLAQLPWIERHVGGCAGSVANLLRGLDAVGASATGGAEAAWAAETAAMVRKGSPTSVLATMAHYDRVRHLVIAASSAVATAGETVRAALEADFFLIRRLLRRGDFAEGVRAVLVEKDNSPEWAPAAFAEVGANEVAALLQPYQDGLAVVAAQLPTSPSVASRL